MTNVETPTGVVHKVKGYDRQGNVKTQCGTRVGRYGSKTEREATCRKCTGESSWPVRQP